MKCLSAPSKLFIAGEYAVLWGGTARVLAVGPRGLAGFCLREEKRVGLLLEGGGLAGEVTPAGVLWEGEVTQPFLFAARAVDAVLARQGKVALGFNLAMAPTPLVGGQKLGLGSSARAAALATKASLMALGMSEEPLGLALQAHAKAQGGKGSGADVAACCMGGLLRYKPPASPGKAPRELRRLRPRAFALAYAFMGRSASTPSMLRRVEARHNEEARKAFVLSSEVLGEQLERAWQEGEFALLAEALEGLQGLLDGLLGEPVEGQEQLLRLARAYGCAGKQSGAGGGDGCILFAPEEERREALLEGLRRRGFWGMPLEVEEGLAMEPNNTAEAKVLRHWLKQAR